MRYHTLDIDFAITINLKLALEEGSAKVTIKQLDLRPAMVKLPIQEVVGQIEPIKEKKTYHQIILEVAQEFVSQTGIEVFTAADLLKIAKQKYPYVKREVFYNRMMAAAPVHSSGSLQNRQTKIPVCQERGFL
jgi:hypothetical protein